MKKIIFALTCALGVMSFTSSENLINDANEDFCNLTFEIEGGVTAFIMAHIADGVVKLSLMNSPIMFMQQKIAVDPEYNTYK